MVIEKEAVITKGGRGFFDVMRALDLESLAYTLDEKRLSFEGCFMFISLILRSVLI
jgi:hypothetical protein